MIRARLGLLLPLALVMLTGWAPAAGTQSQGEPQPGARKRVTVAVNANPTQLTSHIGLVLPGASEIESLIWGGLSTLGGQGVLRPQLGEDVPSIENGLWELFPDGRMVTTWRIKPNVFWHDGVAFTAEDLVFSLTVVRDRQALPFFSSVAYTSIESVEATNTRTVTVRWKEPFINADSLFVIDGSTGSIAAPLPKHVLEQPYLLDKDNFSQLAYWTTEFVGAGPYRVREFARDDHLTLEAFDRYALGRPKIDEIELKLIPDGNTLVANVRAGAVDLTLGRGLSYEQGRSLKEQWGDGRVDFNLSYVIMIYPQFLNTSPPVILNPQFRRALLYGANREDMATFLVGGITPAAHSRVLPDDPNSAALQSAIVQYPYDIRKATELIEGLGYTKGSDGRFRDSVNQPLNIEIRTGDTDYQTKPMLAMADYWQQLGVSVDAVIVPVQRTRDLEYRATFPGLELNQQSPALDNVVMLRSNHAALPENNFQSTSNKNYTRYNNPDMDVIVDRYFGTVSRSERQGIAREIMHWITDELLWMTVYYTPLSTAIGNRMQNVAGSREPGTTSWNVQEWDVR